MLRQAAVEVHPSLVPLPGRRFTTNHIVKLIHFGIEAEGTQPAAAAEVLLLLLNCDGGKATGSTLQRLRTLNPECVSSTPFLHFNDARLFVGEQLPKIREIS
jgi:hypothetical protein